MADLELHVAAPWAVPTVWLNGGSHGTQKGFAARERKGVRTQRPPWTFEARALNFTLKALPALRSPLILIGRDGRLADPIGGQNSLSKTHVEPFQK